jgi:hypothetical protein
VKLNLSQIQSRILCIFLSFRTLNLILCLLQVKQWQPEKGD